MKCMCGRPIGSAHKVSRMILKTGSDRKYRLQPTGYLCPCGEKFSVIEWLIQRR